MEEALGVGEDPAIVGWTLTTLSFELLLGDNLAGKLRVFVHWDKLRTILERLPFTFDAIVADQLWRDLAKDRQTSNTNDG